MIKIKNKKGLALYRSGSGFTLLELLVAMGIFTLISGAVTYLITDGLRYSRIIWDQLEGQSEVRKVLSEVVNDVRRAETSSTGAYPIESASKYSLVFYANIDVDSFREKVRYYLEGTNLKKGVTKPSGSPLIYNSGNEKIVILAHNVINISKNQPVFSFYAESYQGTGNALSEPITTTDVHVVRVQLEIERDANKSPVPIRGESLTQIRNLKTN
ncbi:MAG: hypothetical protein US42_C0008G0054 [Candidatus Magasanikbacteria bacterium GW2011_GWC2_37_14]|uniref:Prepilin-type N-terminal cleavage/methylation domain-containing protein n=1 Tax=Candidatus Magasanikbacteria bacterium GW2011_GWC2_37_14 TaxID=1619046 RepID=A0A0G0G8W7_9BACT|nr:MAG: hypothetical protein US42_C0008G0054 [Candidatus Magasanikbacteria bacterium GW2011_GWC2_37_14]